MRMRFSIALPGSPPHPQRRQACRPATRIADALPIRDQSENREGDRPDPSGIDPVARRRCNRMTALDAATAARPRRPLFQKYFAALFVAVVVPLLANGASEAWFGYRDQRVVLSQRLRAEARMAAG